MTIAEYNQLDIAEKTAMLTRCCGAAEWVKKMLHAPLVENLSDLIETAEKLWLQCTEQAIKEAFDHHPKIGDLNALRIKFAGAASLAANEQSAVSVASDEVLQKLAEGNNNYEKKFGYIFIICATGKAAEEMLQALQNRMTNHPKEEIKIAANEQLKITKLRLQKHFQ